MFNIVAVDDFNMGAMENKSLNIFNSRLVLASPRTATDLDFKRIEGVVAHEYFHNWYVLIALCVVFKGAVSVCCMCYIVILRMAESERHMGCDLSLGSHTCVSPPSGRSLLLSSASTHLMKFLAHVALSGRAAH